jgi:tetratricopeptide (TPR) repeat protein
VYFNAMYDANREYDAGMKSLQEQSDVTARVRFDSVIAKTGRLIESHPGSKYADDAAILKTRSEMYNRMWESAVETSVRAEQLADDSKNRAVAVGLRGVALRELGALAEADSLLSVGLSSEVDADDEALFLFHRGLARQGLGHSDEAAMDLEAAANSVELSPEGRLMLSIALRDIGEYERSADLAGQLLATSSANPRSPLYLHVDSLAVLAPEVVDSTVAELFDLATLPATRRAAFHYLRGRAQLSAGRKDEALGHFDAAIEEAPTSQVAAEAAYFAIEVRLRRVTAPDDVTALSGSYAVARRSGSAEIRARTARWERASQTFEGLIEAFESRGASAAEAMLRAAEFAQIDLESLALARGCYLLYVEVAPDSRWTAKAIYGALSVSGHRPDPNWVADRGAATDDELRDRLEALPTDDPYRLALADPAERGPMADSMYVLAEANLQRRLLEIRMLFDPMAGDAATAADATPEIRDEDEVQ